MSATRPLFSLVMPCYQVERFLPAALDAVRGQTFGDYELIVVDDASPDASGAFAAQVASRDPRVRVLTHPENRGLAAARNTGLAAARGHYVWMPDPDDEYDPSLLSKVALATLEVPGGPDVVLFGCTERYFDERGAHLYDHAIVPPAFAGATPGSWRDQLAALERDTLLGYAWNKCYRLDTLRALGLAFHDLRLIEDIAFNTAFFAGATSVVSLPEAPYGYRKQEGRSLTNANAYGAREYWALHQRRVELVRDMLRTLGAYGDEARATLGGLYVRYVVSFLERTFRDAEPWDGARRYRWLAGVMRTNLYAELVPYAQATSSVALSAAIGAARARDKALLVAIGRAAHLARSKAAGMFYRTRSGR